MTRIRQTKRVLPMLSWEVSIVVCVVSKIVILPASVTNDKSSSALY